MLSFENSLTNDIYWRLLQKTSLRGRGLSGGLNESILKQNALFTHVCCFSFSETVQHTVDRERERVQYE